MLPHYMSIFNHRTPVKLVLWLFILIPHVIVAQRKSPCLEHPIVMQVDNKSIQEVLILMEREMHCSFSYNTSLFDAGRKVSLKSSNYTVRQVLDKLFLGTIQYSEKNGRIILTKAIPQDLISGYVQNSKGEKIANASVYDIHTMASATTDSYGYFEMKINRNDQPLQLTVSKENYRDTIVPLQPSSVTLHNVVITEKKDSTFQKIAQTIGDTLISQWNKVSNWTAKQFTSNPNVRNICDTMYTPFQFSFVPFVGSNGRLSGNIESDWSINLLGGYNAGVRKGEFGGMFNINTNDVRYGQMAGLFNIAGGDVSGLQIAGLTNLNLSSFRGAQVSGLVNLSNDHAYGLSIAGLMNVHPKQGAGVDIAGLLNLHDEKMRGMQLSGFGNINGGAIEGVQIGGFMNVADRVKGIQLAGFMNVTDTMQGLQLAGLINLATKARGMQIGVINLSDSLEGVPFGVFSYVKSGYHKLEVAYDEINYLHLAFRSGSKYFYNIFDIATQPSKVSLSNSIWTLGYGIGTAPSISRRMALNFDVTANQILYKGISETVNTLAKLYVGLDYNFIDKCSISAGVTVNGYISENDPNLLMHLEYWPAAMRERQLNSTYQLNSWIGWRVGLRFF